VQKHCVKQARQSAFVKVRSVPASVSYGSPGRARSSTERCCEVRLGRLRQLRRSGVRFSLGWFVKAVPVGQGGERFVLVLSGKAVMERFV
jgi:hypothetical protein